jgi:hypothetical protein
MSVSHLAEAAGSFEDLVLHRLWLRYLKAWQTVAEEHERLVTMPIASIAASQAKQRSYPSIEFAHSRASRLFKSRLIKRDQFLTLVELSLPDMNVKQRAELQSLIALWTKFLEKKSNTLELTEIGLESRSANSVFWEAVETFRGMDNEPLGVAFRLLAKGLVFLNELYRSGRCRHELITIAVILAQSTSLVKLYLLVSQSALTSRMFRELCTDDEMFVWVKFESVLLKMLVEDPALSAKFFELQPMIGAE